MRPPIVLVLVRVLAIAPEGRPARAFAAGVPALALVLAPSTAYAQDEGTTIGVPSQTSPSPTTAPASSTPAAPAPYEHEPAPPPSWPQRKGFTLEVGIGPAYTTVSNTSLDGGFGLAPLSLTLGGFVSSRVSLGARLGGTSFFEKVPRTTTVTLLGSTTTRTTTESEQVLNGFYGPVMQVFLSDHVFLGGGLGLGLFGVNPLLRSGSSTGLPKMEAGFALAARAGFAFIAKGHHWLGVVLEAYPAFYGDKTAFGMSSILQWQYY